MFFPLSNNIKALFAMLNTRKLIHSREKMGWGRSAPHLFGFVSPKWPLTTMLRKPAHAIVQQLRSYQPPFSNVRRDSRQEGLRTWPECCARLGGLTERERERVSFGSVGGVSRKHAAGVALIMTYRLKLDDSFAELQTLQICLSLIAK